VRALPVQPKRRTGGAFRSPSVAAVSDSEHAALLGRYGECRSAVRFFRKAGFFDSGQRLAQ